MKYTIGPKQSFKGQITPPGDKSISHRAIIFSALAEGVSTVEGLLIGEDVLCTIAVFEQMGVKVVRNHTSATIHGVGKYGLQAPKSALNVGNSGTGMRLLMGLLSGQSFSTELIGDESLSKRPMRRISDPLTLMGAHIETTVNGTPPVHIFPATQLKGIDYRLPVASAQIKSALLFAALYAKGTMHITEPGPSRDHTERMLRAYGAHIESAQQQITFQGGQSLKACHLDVPADISSAAFFMVGASIAQNADVTIKNVGMNPTRTGVINILQAMGADLQIFNEGVKGDEPIADIRVRSAQLHGINIDPKLVPLAIDEFPVLFIAAACAEGTTVLTGAAELRVKESDRIAVMVDAINQMGGAAQATADGAIIQGGQLIGGCTLQSHHDHRIGMACTMASLRCEQPISIEGCETIATSFPNFVDLSEQLGLHITTDE